MASIATTINDDYSDHYEHEHNNDDGHGTNV